MLQLDQVVGACNVKLEEERAVEQLPPLSSAWGRFESEHLHTVVLDTNAYPASSKGDKTCGENTGEVTVHGSGAAHEQERRKKLKTTARGI